MVLEWFHLPHSFLFIIQQLVLIKSVRNDSIDQYRMKLGMETFNTKIFENKIVVVTGGTSGIGQAVAIAFAQKGAKVWSLGLQADKAVYPVGLDIETVEMNVTDKTAVDTFFSKLDRIDTLFNGAGMGSALLLSNNGFAEYVVGKKALSVKNGSSSSRVNNESSHNKISLLFRRVPRVVVVNLLVNTNEWRMTKITVDPNKYKIAHRIHKISVYISA